jgi:hypothetical protein
LDDDGFYEGEGFDHDDDDGFDENIDDDDDDDDGGSGDDSGGGGEDSGGDDEGQQGGLRKRKRLPSGQTVAKATVPLGFHQALSKAYRVRLPPTLTFTKRRPLAEERKALTLVPSNVTLTSR